MTPKLTRQRAIWLGAIAAVALLLGTVGLFAIGDREQLWYSHSSLLIRLPSAGGIEVGTVVRVQGILAGQVEELKQPEQRGGDVLVRIRLESKFMPLLGADARAEVMTEGLIGSKVVEIIPGTPGAGPLAANAVLPGRADNLMADLRQLAQKSDAVLGDLRELSTKTKEIGERGEKLLDDLAKLTTKTQAAVTEIELLTRDLREGQGPMGKEVLGTLRQLQHTAMVISQSFEALKNMPWVGKYLENNAKTLVRPNYLKHVTTFKEDELFPPGRALFTPEGLTRLNAWATDQLPKVAAKGSEIVIVSYQGTATDAQAAEVLSTRQAEAVRTYLIDHHKIDRLGWFTSRTVQAVGMGNRPAPGEPVSPPPPANRLEIIVFTPPGG